MQETQETQEPTTQQPVSNLQQKREQFNALESELQQLGSDESFIKYMTEAITPEMEEMFFENRGEFLTRLFKASADFAQNFETRKGELESLGGEISLEEGQQAIEQAIAQFSQEHPEVNIDELFAFFESLDEATKQQLSSLNPQELLQALFEMMNQTSSQDEQAESAQSEQAQTDAPPPTRLKGVAAENSSTSSNYLPMDRF